MIYRVWWRTVARWWLAQFTATNWRILFFPSDAESCWSEGYMHACTVVAVLKIVGVFRIISTTKMLTRQLVSFGEWQIVCLVCCLYVRQCVDSHMRWIAFECHWAAKSYKSIYWSNVTIVGLWWRSINLIVAGRSTVHQNESEIQANITFSSFSIWRQFPCIHIEINLTRNLNRKKNIDNGTWSRCCEGERERERVIEWKE